MEDTYFEFRIRVLNFRYSLVKPFDNVTALIECISDKRARHSQVPTSLISFDRIIKSFSKNAFEKLIISSITERSGSG